MGKGVYRLGRIMDVHPDAHNVVRTVTVGMRRVDRRESALPYVPKPLEQIRLGVQRICVICPIEDQKDVSDGEVVGQNGAASKVVTVGNAADRS